MHCSTTRIYLARTCLALALAAATPGIQAASAQPAHPLDAAASDPAKLGWMVGAPPPPDRILRFEDGQHAAMSVTKSVGGVLGAMLVVEVWAHAQGRHGEAFGYKTVNTDVLGWVIARVTGRNVAELLSERIWSRLGAEQDAYMTVDSIGTPFAGGGLNTGLRDLARFGEMLRNDGRFNGQQIVPKAVVDDIRRGGDKKSFAQAGYTLLPGWSYRNMWWITHNEDGAYTARGVHGQRVYIDPKAEMVIMRYASHPVAGNAANDPTTIPAFEALARYLRGE